AAAVKRLIGEPADGRLAQAVSRGRGAEVAAGAGGEAGVRLGDRVVAPGALCAAAIRHLCGLAEAELAAPVTHAVLAVPGWFGAARRRVLAAAARDAGLAGCALISEPAAAALAYGVHRRPQAQRLAVVCGGGGGIDVAIIRATEGVFEVIGASGAPLGGEDVEAAVLELVLEGTLPRDLVPPADGRALAPLRGAVAAAVRALDRAAFALVEAPLGDARLRHELTRATVEGCARPLLDRLAQACEAALDAARLKTDHIDEVLLVGGLTRMPALEGRVRVTFGRPLTRFNTGEVVAAGAATLAAVATHELEGFALIEALAHPVLLGTGGGPRRPVLPAGAALPARATRVFATGDDAQDALVLELAAGEGRPARVVIRDLPPAPAGAIRVQVAVTADTDGLLQLEARDTRSGRVLPLHLPAALTPPWEAAP
ncbi:MAG TPA: Hsp70 family protein, partial [Polyangia bacterium]